MSMRRSGQHPDELISAAISGDISEREQAQLDAHLATCESCRQTMAAWTEQRRMVAGLRHAPVPRDLGPRIQAGIESGAFAVPWWRRTGLLVGGVAGLATVAAALVAVAVINGLLPKNQVASTGSPVATASISYSPVPTASAPAGSPSASPSVPPVADNGIPPYYLAYAGPSASPALTLQRTEDSTTVSELPAPSGQPIRAELSPDGRWLAYITPVGLKGTNMYWAADLEDGSHQQLGESSAIGSPFTNGLFWSADSRYLTFTLTETSGGPKTDVWAFDAQTRAVSQVTRRGDVVAAGWRTQPTDSEVDYSRAWVSIATANPTSYELPDFGSLTLPTDPTAIALKLPGVFQPIWNSAGTAAIFWRGGLDPSAEAGYEFTQGGAPYLARDVAAGPAAAFDDATLLFSDVTVGRDAFESAAVTWAAGASDAYAVWDARWAGIPQSGNGSAYPDETRIYFSHLSDDRNIRAGHALDAADIPNGAEVTSVSIAPLDTDYLAITIGFPAPGDLATPEGNVLIIKRNTGDVPDELIRTLKGGQKAWFGPAVYPR